MSVYPPKRPKFDEVKMNEGLMKRIMTATPKMQYLRLCHFNFDTSSVCQLGDGTPTQSWRIAGAVDLDSEHAVRSLGRFLTRAGGRLRSLHIDLDTYTHGRRPTGAPWQDPLCNTWAALNIGACASLEFFRIPICLAPEIQVLQLEHVSLPVTSILRHVSPTLRIVTIVVGHIHRPTLLNNRSVLGLHDLDQGSRRVTVP
ncbi:hypothetical protein C8Q74DRAFT_1440935 [Fomes fomentarius]|nr:hypothetical protein C8Q74DRAFT_1440935 [Fomes fomentarius]